MGRICNCPVGAAIPSVAIVDCPENFGQTQKVAFQRVFASAGTKNTIAVADALLLATWTALMAAADGTKVVPSPFINEPETEPGEPITYGGGNATLGGAEIIVNTGPTVFNSKLLAKSQKTVAALKQMACEVVGVYLFDENGYIGCIADDLDNPTTYYPIPIVRDTMFVGDKNLGGFENPDDNMLRWTFAPNWSDKFVMVKPTDFNPLDLSA